MTAFTPSQHGFPFANWFPSGTPILHVPTPFGRIPVGDAGGGVCGGMVFAALDLYAADRPVPASPTPSVFRYFCRRLLDSFDLPFGVLRYYDLQRRAGASRFVGGVRVRPGVTAWTVEREWPRVQAELDAGRPVPLGLVKADSFDPRDLGKNHQVLAVGYAANGEEAIVRIYDPNYPGDDTATLTLSLRDADAGRPVRHSCEGETVRGFFATEYRRPVALPEFE
jgi:hypothetical protein